MSTIISGRGAGILVRLVFLIWISFPVVAEAQLQNLYPGFFRLANPETFDLEAFGGGFGSESYGTLQEGVEIDQTITPYFSVVGRATGYQVWIGNPADSAVAPGTPSVRTPISHHLGFHPFLFFARVLGGPEFTLYPGTTLSLLAGGDIGDSKATVVEGDFSSWLLVHTRHPVNLAFSSNYDDRTHITSSEIDLRAILRSTETYMITAGGGGAIYGGGTISGVTGQGGPDLGLYLRRFALGIALQGGYGHAGAFGQFSIIKQWRFEE